MKTSKKFLIAGLCFLAVGIILIILGAVVFRDTEWTLGWKPNFAFFIPGVFISFFSVPLIFIGLIPVFAKFTSKLHSETMDYAGKDITEATVKTVDVVAPAIDKTVKIVKNAIVEDTTTCKKCGATVDKNSKFCSQCGSTIEK